MSKFSELVVESVKLFHSQFGIAIRTNKPGDGGMIVQLMLHPLVDVDEDHQG